MSFIKKIGLVCFIVFCCAGSRSAGEKMVESAAAPRIIYIINFIRQTDYRVENADSLLYETVCEQVKLVNKYDLPATFLLQYDALINPLYQDLLKSKLNAHSEIGAWWELTQPLIEAAGIVPKAAVAKQALPGCNIAFLSGEEMKTALSGYLKVLFDQPPASTGGALPDVCRHFLYENHPHRAPFSPPQVPPCSAPPCTHSAPGSTHRTPYATGG